MKLKWIAPLVMFTASAVQAAEVSSTLSFTNDYRFRGISQTAGDAAIQGSMDVAFDNGMYIGAWGSNVDFEDDANLEIDWYAGYAGEISEALSYDTTLYYYTYPGYDAADIDYAEIDFNLYYGDFKLEYAYSNDYVNSSEEGQYVALDYSTAVIENLNVELHAGYSFGDYWDDLDIGDYADYSAGVSSSFASVDLSVAYLYNDVDDGMDVDSGAFQNDETLLLSVSRTF
ncbi:MAG: TorF family putative porin [Amphritea sp.]